MSLKENSKYHKIFQVLQHICSTWEKYTNFKKNKKTNKQTIISRFVWSGLLKSQQNEEGVEVKTHAKVCSKKQINEFV